MAIYPESEARKGYIGAALIGYRLGDDTSIHDVQILAEVPTGEFGPAALKAVEQWKLTTPPPDTPQCRSHRVIGYTFVLE